MTQSVRPDSEDEEVIFSYTRAQALADGVLVDVTQAASEAGFRFPTAISVDLHARLTPNEREKSLGQSYAGRLWDVLYLAAIAGQRVGFENLASIQVGLFEIEEDQLHVTYCGNLLTLWVVVGPGDIGEPVITIGFPEDF